MAITLKPLANIVTKYVSRASAAGPAYVDGVNNPKQDWAASTAASAQSWAAGVQQSITDGRFVAGVNKAGNAKWAGQSINVGASRYPAGITSGQSRYQQGLQPYYQQLSTLTLPPRGPKGDPSNINRVAAVDTALRNLKLQMQ